MRERNLVIFPEGRKKLQAAITRSQGTAAVIVHPFAPDAELSIPAYERLPSVGTSYPDYQTTIKTEVDGLVQATTPIILFEERQKLPDVETTLNRLGINTGSIFVVPTREANPTPIGSTVEYFSQQFATLGLREVTIMGSYFYVRDTTMPYNESVRQGKTLGCVGLTATALQKAGIAVTVGSSVF